MTDVDEPYSDYTHSQVDPTPEPFALTAREEAMIGSLKSVCRDKTATHVLTEYVGSSRTQLWEIRERRGKYLQFVKNFTTEQEGRRFFEGLHK